MSAGTDEAPSSPVGLDTLKVPLLCCKVTWFFFGSVAIVYLSFQYPFFTSIGLKAWDVGVISAVSTIVAGPIAPCWGALADRTGYRKFVMIFLCVAFMVIMSVVPWVGVKLSNVHSNCTLTSPEMHDHVNGTNPTITGVRSPSIVENLLGKSTNEDCNTPAHSQLFWSMLVLWLLASSCLLPLYGLFQSLTMNVVQHTHTSQGCGDQMMFMPVGGGVVSLLAGIFADRFRHPLLTGYEVVYLLIPLLILPLLPSIFVLFKYTKWDNTGGRKDEEKATKNALPPGESPSRWLIYKKIFSSINTVLLLLTILVIGLLMSFNNSFLFLLMKDEMNASKTSMGLTALVQCLSGTVMYFFVERTTAFLGGVVPCMEISVLSYIIRFVATSYIGNPWLVVFPMMLSGFGESLSTAAMMKYMHVISPIEVHSTMFTLMSCLTFALGPCLSHLIGSWFYQACEGPMLYRGAGLVGTAWLLVLLVSFNTAPRIKKWYLIRTNSPVI